MRDEGVSKELYFKACQGVLSVPSSKAQSDFTIFKVISGYKIKSNYMKSLLKLPQESATFVYCE